MPQKLISSSSGWRDEGRSSDWNESGFGSEFKVKFRIGAKSETDLNMSRNPSLPYKHKNKRVNSIYLRFLDRKRLLHFKTGEHTPVRFHPVMYVRFEDYTLTTRISRHTLNVIMNFYHSICFCRLSLYYIDVRSM